MLAYADKNSTDTTIRNLLSNAIKFTPNNGRVDIEAFVITKNKDQFIKFSISDNGIGMSESVSSKLFELGKNSSSLGTNDEKGTGLGLILAKEFVLNNGGEIWVESKIDKGSTFSFLLPAYKNKTIS